MDIGLKDIYEEISQEFDETRQSVWKCVKRFLDSLDANLTGLEIGCGNGKNMLYRKDLNMIGIDFCENFVKMCKRKKLSCFQCDMRNISLEDNIFDFTISIAVLHHLYKLEDRLKTLGEQIRVTKKDGVMLILVWAKKQDEDSKVRFTKSDEMVPWQRKTGEYVYRYYHIYDEGELENEIKRFKNVEIIKSFYEKGNYGIIIKKLH